MITEMERLGDGAVTAHLAGLALSSPHLLVPAAARLADRLRREAITGVTDVSAVYGSVTVLYDPMAMAATGDAAVDRLAEWIERAARSINAAGDQTAFDPAAGDREGRLVEIPVSYGGVNGPDLAAAAERAGLTARQAIDLHCSAEYYVGAVGFLPGFAYLVGLPAALHTPRLATPRQRVRAGSVGIGGAQTGVYPVESPGGWNIIGRTAMTMFDPLADPPAALRAGDRVRFRAIADGGSGP